MKKRAVNKKPCSKCGELFHPGILWRHEKYCGNEKPDKKIKEGWKQKDGSYECPYCKETFSVYGIMLHIYKKHTEDGRNQDPNIGYKNGDRVIWNKGVSMTSEVKKKLSKSLKGKKKAPLSESTKKRMSKSRIKAIKESRIPRWQSISGNSYPEKYFENYLINEGLKFEKQYHINDGRRNYFLDFYFPREKVNLEIDGSQHEWPERIKSDNRRDDFLKSEGIRIIRIKWKNPSKDDTKKYFRSKIEELKFLINMPL